MLREARQRHALASLRSAVGSGDIPRYWELYQARRTRVQYLSVCQWARRGFLCPVWCASLYDLAQVQLLRTLLLSMRGTSTNGAMTLLIDSILQKIGEKIGGTT
jgi:hypothetical protein